MLLSSLRPPLPVGVRLRAVERAGAQAGPEHAQVLLEPGRPLAAVALVHVVGALQQVAGAGHHRGLGLREGYNNRHHGSMRGLMLKEIDLCIPEIAML